MLQLENPSIMSEINSDQYIFRFIDRIDCFNFAQELKKNNKKCLATCGYHELKADLNQEEFDRLKLTIPETAKVYKQVFLYPKREKSDFDQLVKQELNKNSLKKMQELSPEKQIEFFLRFLDRTNTETFGQTIKMEERLNNIKITEFTNIASSPSIQVYISHYNEYVELLFNFDNNYIIYNSWFNKVGKSSKLTAKDWEAYFSFLRRIYPKLE